MRWVIAAACLCACDRVYGLQDRVDPVSDALGSGSSSDSSVDAPAPHDEDADGVDDAGDNCPGFPNDQTDTDFDDIGDACDPLNDETRPNHRVLFDPFVELSTTAWTPNTVWTSDGDTVGPDPGQPAADGFRLTHRSADLVAGTPWLIDVAIDLPASPTTFKFIGTHLVDLGTSSVWLCAVYFADNDWRVTAGGNAVTTSIGSPTILRNLGAGTAQDTNRCGVANGQQTSAMVQPQPYPVLPQLWTQFPARYRFIDVIQ